MKRNFDIGGVKITEEQVKRVGGRTRGDTQLVAYDIGWTEAIIEREGRFFSIDPTNNFVPEELTSTEAMLSTLEMCLASNRPHLRRRAHLDQVIGRVRRNFEKGGWHVTKSILEVSFRLP